MYPIVVNLNEGLAIGDTESVISMQSIIGGTCMTLYIYRES